MLSPFPGMDPYLERPGIWQQVHADLIVDIRRFLAPLLRPRYHVAIEQNTYLTLLPPPEHRVGVPMLWLPRHKSLEPARQLSPPRPPLQHHWWPSYPSPKKSNIVTWRFVIRKLRLL